MANLDFGLWMTAMGMGTVFGLLIVLMLILQLMGRLDRPPKAKPVAAADDPAPLLSDDPEALTEDEIAAITIAVTTHARIRRAQAAPEMRAHEPGSHLFANRWVGIGRGYQQQPWSRG